MNYLNLATNIARNRAEFDSEMHKLTASVTLESVFPGCFDRGIVSAFATGNPHRPETMKLNLKVDGVVVDEKPLKDCPVLLQERHVPAEHLAIFNRNI